MMASFSCSHIKSSDNSYYWVRVFVDLQCSFDLNQLVFLFHWLQPPSTNAPWQVRTAMRSSLLRVVHHSQLWSSSPPGQQSVGFPWFIIMMMTIIISIIIICSCLTPYVCIGGLVSIEHQTISFSLRCLGSFLRSWLCPIPAGRGGGVYSGFQVTGRSNGGKNQNPKKSLDKNITPKKIPCRISEP